MIDKLFTGTGSKQFATEGLYKGKRFLMVSLAITALLFSGCVTSTQKVSLSLNVQERGTDLPVNRAQVKVYKVENKEHPLATKKTDSQGQAEFKLPKGGYSIIVDKEGYVQNAEDTNREVSENVNYITMQLERQVEVYGVVQEPDESLAENVVIELTNKATREVYTGSTASDGSYSIKNLPAGEYEIKFESLSEKNVGEKRVKFRMTGEKMLREERLQLNIKLEPVVIDHKMSDEAVGKQMDSGGGGTPPKIK